MKPIYLISALIFLFLFSNCNKNRFVPQDEIPQWLKDRIIKDEAVIDSAPELSANSCAWIRYKFKKDYYFEYDNPLSSVMLEVYDYDGNELDYYNNELLKAYDKDKCCKRYVWKAPEYIELNK